MKKRCTVKELLDVIEEIEGKRISETAIRKSLKRHGVLIGDDKMVDVEQALKAREAGMVLDKSKITEQVKRSKEKGEMFAASYHEARIKQIELQCEKTKIEIAKIRSELVNRKEEEARFRAEWAKARKAVEDWRAHETAKHPDHADTINGLADRLCGMIHDA